ncbi:carbohydrate porin [Thaumasiovibrio sp. DFM-14]|uniref:carbohydrate porin n=1 Tax=Thaumasiovibrio sp. DFM-14 TaxID=3384792 RepID=UPI0039A1CE2D
MSTNISKSAFAALLLTVPGIASASFLERNSLTDGALNINAEYTNYLQQVTSGVDDADLNTAHRLDVFLSAKTADMGLWDGGSFHSQTVYRHNNGNDLGYLTATPTNVAYYGSKIGEPFISSLYYMHGFENGQRLLAGKIDAIELGRNSPFYGGAGRYGFANLNFAAPPSGVTPPSFFGAMYMFQALDMNWTAMLYDPRDRYERSLDFKELFKDGANLSLSATYPMTLAGRGTAIGLSATYSTESGADWLSIGSDVATESEGKYNLRVQFSHNLAEQGAHNWGLYLRGAIADGNPNLLSSSFSGGLGGSALFFDRPQDTWGIGYYSTSISNDMQDRAEEMGLEIKDESGAEAFYAYQAAPWLTFTGNVQVRNTQTLSSEDNDVVVVGLRTTIKI